MDLVDQNPNEVLTWIVCKDKEGMTIGGAYYRSMQLSIFKAPMHVIVMLISVHPESGLCKNDQGMVPLKLAFCHGASDSILYKILSSCPDAIDVKDDKGRTPLALYSTYVARANAQGTPTNGADNNTQKMHPSTSLLQLTEPKKHEVKAGGTHANKLAISNMETLLQ
jgi:hypothetical protein